MSARQGPRKDASSRANYKFNNAADIRRALQAKDEHALVEGLTALRNQFTIKHDEPPLNVSDERLLLAKAWLESSTGVGDLFVIWESTSSRQTSVLIPLVGVLSALLTLLSPYYLYHALAQPIISNLLLPQWAHRLNTYLAGANNELTLVSLKLFYALSCFANGRERKSLFEVFAWEAKSLPKLLHMRRKGRADDGPDILAKPDIRTLFVLLLLSFVEPETQASVKSAFLEQRRDIFSSVFRGLWQDPYTLVRRVLEVCWTGLWSDPKVKRTLKVHVFNETVLAQLLRVYERDSPEEDVADRVPADVVHHFLLAICTRPGVGICFKDNGWYPRDVGSEDSTGLGADATAEDSGSRKQSRINNKILANVLKTLRVNEDPRQQELALKILSSCPELVAGYWPAAALTLEPRLSSKWIANIAFFGQVISLPVPVSSFHLQPSGASSSTATPQYNPTPPPLSSLTENILPAVNIKAHLSRGLQAPSPLVRHCTALALAMCLLKYDAVLRTLRDVECALEEDADGQWTRRRAELEREIRRRVPDFQVVLGFAQKSAEAARASADADADGDVDMQGKTDKNPVRGALLAESAQRLLWLYHRCVPALVAETRFDVGKLLLGLQYVVERPAVGVSTRTEGLDTLRQLHVLRLLSESDQFNWSGKAGGSHSNLYILLKMYTVTPSSAIRSATADLLRKSLAGGLLFQHDPDELVLWLRSLPFTTRPSDVKAPDGTPLTDERDAVITFMDECAQHCAKTPYRYLDELRILASEGKGEDVDMDETDHYIADRELLPSPLLMTVSEQLAAKLRGKHISPSNALAVITFLRKLVCHLMSKTCRLNWLKSYVERLRSDVFPLATFSEHPSIASACQSEAQHLEWYFQPDHPPTPSSKYRTDRAVEEHIKLLEQSPIPESETERRSLAASLVDMYRFARAPLPREQIVKFITAIEGLHKPTLRAFFEHLRPDQHCLWELVDVPARYSDLQNELLFDVLLAHCEASHIEDPAVRGILANALVLKSSNLSDVEGGAMLIGHRLRASLNRNQHDQAKDVLVLLAQAIENARRKFEPHEYEHLVMHVFGMDMVKQLCEETLSAQLRQGLEPLLRCVPRGTTDQNAAARFARFWAMRTSAEGLTSDELETARLWIPLAEPSDLLAPLDHFAKSPSTTVERVSVVEDILHAMARSTPVVQPKPETIAALHSILPHSKQLEVVLGTLLHNRMPLCYDGLPLEKEVDLRTLVAESAQRWQQSTARSDSFVSIDEVLRSQWWSDSTADSVVSLIYREPSARSPVLGWLKGDMSICTTPQLARILCALLDCSFLAAVSQDELAHLVPLYRRVLRGLARGKGTEDAGRLCVLYVKTTRTMIEQLDPIRGKLLEALLKECEKMGSNAVSLPLIRLVASVSTSVKTGLTDLSEELLSKALPWVVQRLASGEALTPVEMDALADLSIIANMTPPRAHHVETVLTVIPQQSLGDAAVINFARALVQATTLKPFVINKFLQSIVQHPQLYAVSGQDAEVRDALTDLLLTLFRLHPSNTCQPTHIEPLLRLYGGSLSLPDTKVLAIFRLFESVRKTSCATLLSRWSASPAGTSSNSLEAVLSLEPSRVLKTCLEFPQHRRFSDDVEPWQAFDAIYDPVFLILLFSQTLASSPPSSALGWIQLFRSNIVSLLIRAVSAKDERIRSAGLAQLAALHKTLQDVDMQEQPHVLYILNLLKDALTNAPRGDAPRLPAFTTLILAHALRAVFYPSNFIYPITARFLLQRPQLDTHDVPLLFSMLYSASDQWKKERGWVVRFLSDAMVGADEWRVMQRRHTWDLLASLFQSDPRDRALRRGVLEVLANITCHARATTSLVLKSALLAWIEMQLCGMGADEPLAWVKILANVLSVVDPAKIEAATNGEWRLCSGRCLRAILKSAAFTTSVLPYATDLLLRLVLLTGSPLVNISQLVQPSLKWLQTMEEDIGALSDLPLSDNESAHHHAGALPPHTSRALFDYERNGSVNVWGECVERLWRTCMSRDMKCPEWDALNHRLLVWNAIRAGRSVVGEWARRETIQCLGLVP